MFNPLTILLLILLGVAFGAIVYLVITVNDLREDIDKLDKSRKLAINESELAQEWRKSANYAIERLEEFKADVLRKDSVLVNE